MSDNLISVFKANTDRLGEHTAIDDPATGVKLTYKELDLLSGRIASKLKEKGVGKGNMVPIILSDGTDYIAAIIGVMKLGAAAVTLSASFPEERVKYIYKDCGAGAVVGDGFTEDVRKYPPFTEKVTLSEDDPALAIYTSGSTGTPKGVLVGHGALFAGSQRVIKATGMKQEDVSGAGANFNFLAAVEFLFCAISLGMTVIPILPEILSDPDELAEVLSEYQVTVCFISPKVLRYFKPKSKALRLVVTAGERLSGVYSDEYHIENMYGSTELGGTVFSFPLDRSYDNTPIGVPMEGISAYILNADGEEAEEGELCITGPTALGYINLPDESAGVFVKNPFQDRDGHPKLCRTGDIVRRLEDGNILYLNRKDWMVQINGQRVEPGEVEAVLRRMPDIIEAAVTGHTDTRGNVSLAAYYVSDRHITAAALRDFLGEYLPEYMIPRYFIPMEKLPLNPSGKLDRKALPEPDTSFREVPYEAPAGQAEYKLCQVFEEVLGLKRGSVGRNDDFFLIGGDSIRAIEVMMRADLKGLSARMIYREKTARRIAEALAGQKTGDPEAYEEEARLMRLPATLRQERIFQYLAENPASAAFNLAGLYYMGTGLDAERLARAVDETIKNHPALCTVFDHDENGNIIQYIRPDLPEKTGIREVSEEELEAFQTAPLQIFTSFRAPLVRSLILCCGDERYFYTEVLHVLFDAGSIGVVFRDIARAYRGEELSRDHYYSYIRRECEIRGTETFKSSERYFAELLKGKDWCAYPKVDFAGTDAPYGQDSGRDITRAYIVCENFMTVEEMAQAERNTGCSRNVLSVAAVMKALREYCLKEEIRIDVVHHNRLEKEYLDTVGPLYRILPVAVDLSEYPDDRDLLMEVNRQVIDGAAKSPGDPAAGDAVSCKDALQINYVSDLETAPDEEGFEMVGLQMAEGQEREIEEHVYILIFEEEDHIFVQLEYLKCAYREESMQRFLDMFAENLKRLVI